MEPRLDNKVELKILIAPVIRLLGKTKYTCRLVDGAYGEFLIFRNHNPVYYLNLFDKEYEGFKEKIFELKESAEDYINECLNKKSLDLSTKQRLIGLRLKGKEKIKKIIIEKLPTAFLE